jgi:phosphatidylinositol glycan class B
MITALSTISHKEVRFIYPLLPILHVLAAPSVVSFFTTTNGNATTSSTSPPSAQGIKLRGRRLLLLTALTTTNLTIGYYTTQLHQRGVIDVLDFLRHQYKEEYLPSSAPFSISNTLYNSTSSISSSTSPDLSSRDRARPFAAFLTPCHSTPWRSHLIHSDLHAWSLTCEPPLHIPASSPLRRSYRDEADRFYDDPQLFLSKEIGQKGREWPRYVVGFEGIGWWLAEFFMQEPFREEGKWGEDGGMGVEKMELREVWRGFNSHWHDDWRRKGHVIVWEVVTVTPWETED